MQWESGIGAAETGNEMIFERADSSLCSISAMDTGWCQLEVDWHTLHVLLERHGRFIVESLEFRLEALRRE